MAEANMNFTFTSTTKSRESKLEETLQYFVSLRSTSAKSTNQNITQMFHQIQTHSSTSREISNTASNMESKASAPPKTPRPYGLVTITGEEVRPYEKMRLITSFSEVITLVVGKEEQKFLVHKKVLCAASPFFEAACKPEWMKDGPTIKLPEDEPHAVQTMINWMYQNELCIPRHQSLLHPATEKSMFGSSQLDLFVKLYVLGQKYQMPMLRNDAVDGLDVYVQSRGPISVQGLNIAWNDTPTDSALRGLLLKLVKANVFPSDLEEKRAEIQSPEFWSDIAIELLFNYGNWLERGDCEVQDDIEWSLTFCEKYHTHEDCFLGCEEKKAYTLYEDPGL